MEGKTKSKRKIEKMAYASDQNRKEKDYWLNKLSGELVKSTFPYDMNPGVEDLNGDGRRLEVFKSVIPDELFPRLMKISGGSDAKLHVLLAAGLIVLLGRYTGNDDIIIAVPIYKQAVAGDFINTVLSVRNRLQEDMTFRQMILQVHESIFDGVENQNYPIEALLYHLNLPVSGTDFPLFETAILLENIHDEAYLRDIFLNMIFSFLRTGDSVEMAVKYNAQLYKETTAARISSHFHQLLQEVLFHVERELSDIDILTGPEKKQLLFGFNDTAADFPAHTTIHELSGKQVEKTPDQVALIGQISNEEGASGQILPALNGNISITYSLLDEKAGQLAYMLRDKSVRPGTIVGIMVERSVEMIIGILAILKAGGAYLPIDPDYPRERINYMLADSHARILLTTENIARAINFDKEMIYLNTSFHPSTLLPVYPSDSSNLAYTIYTSGTTGKPKGSLIQHQNVVRLLFNDRFQFDFSSRDVWTMFHSYCFDFSVWEMYGALLYGGKLVLIEKMTAQDPVSYLEVLKKEKVTVLNQTPSAFYNLIDEELKSPHQSLKLRYIIFGGEALQPVKLKKWREKYPGTRLINMYGITETTVHVTFKEIGNKEIEAGLSNIGKAIPTLSVYIMDHRLKLLPIGVPGEICVGGAGVGRGYLNRQELTREKFTRNPYRPDERLYRSGDLGQLLENGEIQYLGRSDLQVKIRGFRIEPGEIESRLLQHPGVKEAVVISREDETGNKSLCAYVVPLSSSSSTNDLSGLLREYLTARLPGYMIPLYFVELEDIPLTANGKVDRKKLPSPSGVVSQGTYEAPRSQVQEKLINIWKNVLELEKLGITNNFFHVGGDSIKAIKLVNAINHEFNAFIKLADLYVNETVERLSLVIEAGQSADSGNELAEVLKDIEALKTRVISKANTLAGIEIEDLYPMSDIEKGMVYHSLKEPGKAIYHDQMVHQLTAVDFEPERFEKALALLVEKHPILRTGFHSNDFEEEFQVVHKYRHTDIDFEHMDISRMRKQEQQEYIMRYKEQDRKRPFDFSTPPLWRMRTFAIDKDHVVILWSFHHAILDGWSDASFKTELNNTYLRLKTEPGYMPGKLKSSYKDYVLQQMAYKNKRKPRDYWKRMLTDYKRLEFPGPVAHSTRDGDSGNAGYSRRLGTVLLNQLNNATIAYNTSLKSLCFAAYIYMLSMLSYENDITAGMVIHNRPVCEDGEKILGCFLNTMPVRIRIHPRLKWQDYISLVDKKLLELTEYGQLSLFEIAGIAGEEDGQQNPIFDTLFNFIDYHVYREINRDDILEKGQGDSESGLLSISGQGRTNTLLDFTMDTSWGDLQIVISYSQSTLHHKMVKKCCDYYKTILERLIIEPGELMGKDKIVSKEEKKQLLNDFNSPRTGYAKHKSMHRLFEDQVERTPDHTALAAQISKRKVAGAGMHLSYRELNKKSDQVVYLLEKKGVKPGTITAVNWKRSIEMIVGILGILKTGGGYLPLNPNAPAARNQYVLDDCNIDIVLGHGMLDLESDISGRSRLYSPGNSPPGLAYIIYTSGSTGKPKGVLINHSNISPLLHWGYRYLGIGPEDRTLQNLAFYFDWSVWEIFITLTSGASLIIFPEELLLDPQNCVDFINANSITILHVTPSQDRYIVNLGRQLEPLKFLFIGGEKLPFDLVADSFALVNDNCRLFNMYGPTETAIISTALEIDRTGYKELRNLSGVPIGKPVGNNILLVLDSYRKVCPVNVTGQLYIAGDGLSKGYLNRPELTAEKFIESGVQFKVEEKEESRMQAARHYPIYITGDMTRWLPDGNMEFIGRIDHQVKIRGFRIELGEIEARLSEHDLTREVVVLDREDENGEKYLIAYIVPAEGTAVNNAHQVSKELNSYLSRLLPAYMIPSYFTIIKEMPLTPNGKIDRKVLPAPGLGARKESRAPQTEIEKKLAAVWADVLGAREPIDIGIDDDFFQQGGHSLKATLLASRIQKVFNVNMPLAQIFITPTIKELAEFINEGTEEIYTSIQFLEKKEYYPLSSAQKRLFILQQLDASSTVYNIPAVFPLPVLIEKERLEEIFQQLLNRHESLRTSFQMKGLEPVQRIHDEVEFEINYDDASQVEFIRSFDLSRAPLLRVSLVKRKKTNHLLMVDVHHIITDGTSMDILLKDFQALSAGKQLPFLGIQYKEFAHWQNRMKSLGTVKQQEAHWLKRFPGEIPAIELPLDYPRPLVQSFAGSVAGFWVGKKESQDLKKMADQYDSTLYMLLLSVFNLFLSRISGQEDIVIGCPVAGRRHADLQDVMGMFVNILALRNFPIANTPFLKFLKGVRQNTIAAFDNQDYQFEDLVEKLELNRDTGRNPVFDVVFNLLNQAEYSGEIPGSGEENSDMHPTGTSKFDLTYTAVEVEGALYVAIEYCTALFNPETIQRFSGYFRNVLLTVVENPGIKLYEVDISTREEKNQILFDFNNTSATYPQDKTIHRLFREQWERAPDHMALLGQFQNRGKPPGRSLDAFDQEVSITYRELNQNSDRLAYILEENGIKPDTIVAIMSERSVEMVIGILGILKAGGAYLPVDPDYPEERIKYMLADSRANLLVTTGTLAKEIKKFRSLAVKKIFVEEIFEALQRSSQLLNFSTSQHLSSSNLAYIIYTSGTTGRPKAAMVQHRSVVRLVKNTNYVEFGHDSRILQTGALEFDASTFEIWGSLINGLQLFLVSNEIILSAEKFKATMQKYGITIMWLTSPLFNQLLEQEIEIFSTLRDLLVGGDILSPSHINRLRNQYPRLNVINGYGPTENTTFSTTYPINKEHRRNIPIGKPIANSTVYIVDRINTLLPIGIVGELIVGGDGVARGYLNNPGLTAAKFDRSHMSYTYKTGDLARWLPDGNIEFSGRIDQQIKIRGYRIESEEIESLLMAHDAVKEAVVTTQNEGEKKNLCAYVVAYAPGNLNISALREYLSGKLPGYMNPAYFVEVECIPLTENGKVDRKKLLTIKGEAPQSEVIYVAPNTELEKLIADAWAEVLQLKKVGLYDNFFELGGNSLTVIKLNKKLKECLKRDIPVVELFKNQTIHSFTQYLTGKREEEREESDNGNIIQEKRASLIARAKRKQQVQKSMRRRR